MLCDTHYSSALKRDELLQVRINGDEKAAFDDAAEIAGINVAAWARQQLRLAAMQELSKVGRRAPFLKSIPLTTDGDTHSI
jgi:hypothetical protein